GAWKRAVIVICPWSTRPARPWVFCPSNASFIISSSIFPRRFITYLRIRTWCLRSPKELDRIGVFRWIEIGESKVLNEVVMTVSNLPKETAVGKRRAPLQEMDSVTIRFAGDSGDGMQLAGTQFTNSSAILGNDISTLPDFPAEIRAPAGTLAGVSGFQVHF